MNRKQRRSAAKLGQMPGNPVKTASAVVAPDAANLFGVGLKHHQAGRLAEAEASYRRLLAAYPNHADALHLLGLVAHQMGRHDVAVELIRQAIQRNGQNPGYFSNLGVALKEQGKRDEAVAAYRAAISIKPDLAEAHSNLGNVLKEQGKRNEAVAAYRQAISLKPDYAEAHRNLGVALNEQGKRDEAVAAYRRAISLKPDYAEAHSYLGVALNEQGKLDEAVAAHRQAISIKPDYAEAHSNLGNALREQGKRDQAFAAYRQAISIKPDYAEAHYNLGVALNEQGKRDEAVAAYRQAISIKPDLAEAHSNLGVALKEEGKRDEAIAAYRQAIVIKPDYAEAHSNLGNALNEQGKLDEAVAACRRAISIKPDHAEAHSNLGNALNEQGKRDEAVAAYAQAISIKPDHAEAHCNLGIALNQQGKLDEALAAYRRAISIKADLAEAHSNLGIALKEQGKLDEALAAYRRAVSIKPDYAEAFSNLLFCLNYDDKSTVDQLFAAHREWDERYGRQAARPSAYANAREAGRRLRIGYVSPDFRRHSVAYFLEPLLRAHDHESVEVFCYAEVAQPDAMTLGLRGFSDHWLVTVGMADDALAQRISADSIDILVDLAGHTGKNRLRVFARKPAPVQVTWLGYPNTTGLNSIDYRLVDAVTDPEGVSDALASETLIRLDGSFLCYAPEADAPAPAPPPSLTTGVVTFGSFNNPAKVSAATLDVWAALLVRRPEARLLLKGMPFADAATRAEFLARLGERGVAAERVELMAWLPDAAAHLALYHRLDIALDPFPYNGTTTTCEALWMGVPVVARRSDRHAGRVGASLLGQIGRTDLIAGSAEEYVEIALALADDPARLNDLRYSLRPRLAASSLCDADAFARKIEAAYRRMWQHWCEAPTHAESRSHRARDP